MTSNLLKRILTSAVLLALLFLCLLLNRYSWLTLIIIASIISFFEFNNLINKIKKKNNFFKFSANIVCFLYLFFFTYSANELYKINLNFIIIILLACIFSDVGGYVIGKTVGGKKLTKISPNKTISGSIGSFIFSLFPVIFFFLNYDFKINLSLISLLVLCLLTSLTCQIGDLLISFFKRKANLKDTGSILPGHGGLLDRIDGIIFALPSIYIITIL